MRAIVNWIIARPERSVLALTGTFVLPLAPAVLSGTVMVLLVLAHGAVRAGIYGLLAAAVLAAMGLLAQAPVMSLVGNAVIIWGLAVALAGLLAWTRSLALAVQMTVIVAIAVTLGIFLVVDDTAAVWADLLAQLAATFSEAGLDQQSRFILAQQPHAGLMTGVVVSAGWTFSVALLLIGYGAYRLVPTSNASYGDFQQLGMGRVLAIVLAVVALGATFSGALWLVNLAIVMLLVFWLQGLAMLHWFKGAGRLPLLAFIAIYAALLVPVSAGIMVFGLALLGYCDAWFDLRRKMVGKAQ
jgi:hypothetical protein